MKFFFKLIGILFVLLLVVASWWQKNYPSENWKYRMTVTVETPEGLKTGSAVREIKITRGVSFSPHALSNIKLKGESVVVDLGERGVLFALLKGEAGGHDYAHQVAIRHFPKAKDWEPDMGGQKVALPEKEWPMFVMFEDMNDPKTVRTASYAAKVFGEGVSIKSVTIEMTDEDVTTGILEYLPWLPERKNVKGYLGGDDKPPFNDPTFLYLNGSEFAKGTF